MGRFDFFRPKSSKPRDDHLAIRPADMPEAGCHHYFLAHHALRSIAFHNPMGFLGVLTSEDAEPFLQDVLTSVAKHCQPFEPEVAFSARDIAIHKKSIGIAPCVVIEMPPARGVTEAIFVAAVLTGDVSLEKLRYFTLEVGVSLDGPPRTVLCEWTVDGTHANYGDGPEPELDEFVAAVTALLQKR
jgi:hypothetical protein